MNQKGYRTTTYFFFYPVEMLNLLYILEALRHNTNNTDARTSTWMNQKGYRTTTLAYFFFLPGRNA